MINFSIFNRIIRFVYEPLFIVFTIALFYFLLDRNNWKKPLFIAGIASLIFMIDWRLLVKIHSDRYAANLIIPISICVSYFLFQIPAILTHIWRIPERTTKIVGRICIGAMLLGCLLNVFHNSQYNFCLENSRKINPVLGAQDIVYAKENIRYAYYLDRNDLRKAPLLGDDDAVELPLLKLFLRAHQYHENSVFLIVDQRSEQNLVSAKDLGLSKLEEFECISWEYKSRRKKSREVVYRYRSAARPRQLNDPRTLPFTRQNNITRDGDFEQPMPEEAAARTARQYFDKNLIDYGQPELALPRDLYFYLPQKLSTEERGSILLTYRKEQVISGKSSLVFSTEKQRSFICPFMDMASYTLQFAAQGNPGGTLSVEALVFKNRTQFIGKRKIAEISPEPLPRVYQFEIPDGAFSGEDRFALTFTTENNTVMIDDLMILKHCHPIEDENF